MANTSSNVAEIQAAELANLLRGYSAEVTSGDRQSIDAAKRSMPPGAEVFVASLPSDKGDRQVTVAVELRRAGLTPVPHIVARNLRGRLDFDTLLARLVNEAGVDRALILGGDRAQPSGEFSASLQLLETGLLNKHRIRKVALGWYPEGHPRISAADLATARAAKLKSAAEAGIEACLISQFCLESAPIIASAQQLRAEGVKVPLRVGVAGPASRTALLKYAMICGVGASIRALKERPDARGVLAGDTPEVLLTEVAHAQSRNPELGIQGVHFFTFASFAATAQFVAEHRNQEWPRE